MYNNNSYQLVYIIIYFQKYVYIYREKVDIFNSSYDLIYFIINESSECIQKLPFNIEQFDELGFAYSRTLKRINRLKAELERTQKLLFFYEEQKELLHNKMLKLSKEILINAGVRL